MGQHGDVSHERSPERSPQRSGYHHGDLHNALSAAGADLAREGGPEAVILREAARRVGVSPTAAYRHFANHAELLRAVKHEAVVILADALMAALAAADQDAEGQTAQQRALARMTAMGHEYVRFALDNPGLFRTGFCHSEAVADDPSEPEPAPHADQGTIRAFQTLSDVLDEMLAAGLIVPARRPGAEATAWALVHGLAMLMLDGPLRVLEEEEQRGMVQAALSTFAGGLAAETEPGFSSSEDAAVTGTPLWLGLCATATGEGGTPPGSGRTPA
jgi:AcrR family transcriptional regulator